jgi:uncharacterized membrane protein HdeD (DUF308 family)
MDTVAAVSQPTSLGSSRWGELWPGLFLLVAGVVLNQVPWYHSIGAWLDLLTPLVAFFIAVTGLIWCVIALFHWSRERHRVERSLSPLGLSTARRPAVTIAGMQRRTFFWILILAGILSVVFGLFYLAMQFVQTGADRTGQCGAFIQAADETGLIPKSIALAGRPAMGCGTERYGMLLSPYNDLSVWGVIDRKKQDQILHALSTFQRQNHTLPMRVSFFENENWTEHPDKNGGGWGVRGQEKLIRVVPLH